MYPANICLDKDVLKTSLVFVFRRRLQGVLIKTSIFALLIRLQKTKTSSSRRTYSSWSYVFKSSSRRFLDVFKTSSRRFQDIFKTSSSRLQDIFKTFSRRTTVLGNTISRRFRDVYKTFLRGTAKTIICRRFA